MGYRLCNHLQHLWVYVDELASFTSSRHHQRAPNPAVLRVRLRGIPVASFGRRQTGTHFTSSMSFTNLAPVTMNSVCQMPRQTRGTNPVKSPVNPDSATTSFITPGIERAGCPAAARACASMRATSKGWFLRKRVRARFITAGNSSRTSKRACRRRCPRPLPLPWSASPWSRRGRAP